MINVCRFGYGVLLAVLAAVFVQVATADTILCYQVFGGSRAESMQIMLRPNAIRIEGAALGPRFKWLLYKRTEDVLFAVSPAQKEVLVLDAAGVDYIRRNMRARRVRLQQEMEQMPSWKRKFLESQVGHLLEQREIGAVISHVEMKGDTAWIADVECQVGDIIAAGLQVGALCLASADTLGLANSAFDSYRRMYRLINGLERAMASGASDPEAPAMSELDGVPLFIVLDASGVVQILQRLIQQPLSDDKFEIPASYKQQEPQDLLEQVP